MEPMPPWTPEVFKTVDGSCPFETFVKSLTDFKLEALDFAIQRVLCELGQDAVKTEWMKALKDGLYEFRIRKTAEEIAALYGGAAPVDSQGAPEDVLLRVFVHFYGNKVVLLLGGYDKGKASGDKKQDTEIAKARKLLTQFKEQQKRAKKRL